MVLALIGVGLGVALMSTLLSLSEGMDQRLESTLTQVAADITVAPADAPFGGQLSGGGTPLPSTYLEKIEKVATFSIFATKPFICSHPLKYFN